MESHHRRKSSVKVVSDGGGSSTTSSSLLPSTFEASSSSFEQNQHPSRSSSSVDLKLAGGFHGNGIGNGNDSGHYSTSESENKHDHNNKDHPTPQGRCCKCRPHPNKSVFIMLSIRSVCSSIRVAVLLVLCLQNSLFTVLRRYSQGILLEQYSKYECLLLGEIIKIVFSAYMIRLQMLQSQNRKTSITATTAKSSTTSSTSSSSAPASSTAAEHGNSDDTVLLLLDEPLKHRLVYLIYTSRKMMVLAILYGAMNILSFVSLRNIGAGLFTIVAQAKIVTTAVCSAIMLQRHYTPTQWRALLSLVLGVILFSEPVWNNTTSTSSSLISSNNPDANPWLGTIAVLIEVTLSGFASIYFEKVIKLDPLQLTIWERNFQLALGSVPVYLCFIAGEGGGLAGFFGGWSFMAVLVSVLGAAGGLLVALSIKYGDAILKTLATTGAIVLSSVLDHFFLRGPLTPIMMMAGLQVILAICNYTFDATTTTMPSQSSPASGPASQNAATIPVAAKDVSPNRSRHNKNDTSILEIDEEQIALLPVKSDASEGTGGGSSSRKGE